MQLSLLDSIDPKRKVRSDACTDLSNSFYWMETWNPLSI